MTALPHADQANALARWSLIQAIWPLFVLAALAIAAAMLDASPALGGIDQALLVVLAGASSLAMLFYSATLGFDALLFRVIASYEDGWKGGAAVDDILARMRLKPIPANTRSLTERAAGTRRLATRQRIALAATSAAMLLLLILPRPLA